MQTMTDSSHEVKHETLFTPWLRLRAVCILNSAFCIS